MAIELDHGIGFDRRSAVRILTCLVDYVEHILSSLLFFGTHFVNTKEQALLYGDVLAGHGIILEQVTDELDQSLLDLKLDVAGIAKVLLAYLQV